MHWVNPPHLIPLVEVIAGEKSSEEALQIVYDVALSLEQKPVRVYKDPTGFILNRLQYAIVLRGMPLCRGRICQSGGRG